uniref:Insulin-like domain-containing protein n=1 Tax=Cacopsylla melanoneura TaxID=428564 RepID=A0A8D8LNP4_9HEMI
MVKAHPQQLLICILLIGLLKLGSGNLQSPLFPKGTRTIQKCGSLLVDNLEKYCTLWKMKNGKRANMGALEEIKTSQDLTDDDFENMQDMLTRLEMDQSEDDRSNEIVPIHYSPRYFRLRRHQRQTGLSNECCIKPCNINTLLSYCQ